MRFIFILLLFFCFQTKAQDWVQVASLPNAFNETDHSFGFSFGDMGYLVSGSSNSGVHDDFYQYDPIADTWTELTPFPGGARGFAIGDTWDGKAYFGFGSNGNTAFNDLWVFDPDDMSWTELSSCPCAARRHPAMIAHNGKVFVGLGDGNIGNLDDWWEYDIASDTWSQKDDLPSEPRHHPYQFGIGDYVYTGFGHGDGIFNDWFRYDIENESWAEVEPLPAEARVAGTQFSHNGLGYVLSGDGNDHFSMATGEFWSYDPVADSWQEMPPHPGSSRWAPASFVINGEAYIINGPSFFQYITEVYKFSLDNFVSTPHPIAEASVTIYPNPSTDIINISVSGNLQYRATLYDIEGRLIVSSTNESILELQDLSQGTYLLEIEDLNSGETIVERIVKQD